MSALVFHDLAKIEPRLLPLADLAAQGGNAQSWRRIKLELNALVGFHAADPRMQHLHRAGYDFLLDTFENAGGRF